MLGNTGRSRMERNKLPCTSLPRLFSGQEGSYLLIIKDYMGILSEGLITSLDLRTKISNKKQREMFFITDITNQDFRKLIKNLLIHII